MANANYELLRDMIARNAAAVLSLPSAGIVRHLKTRFLAEAENGFWVEAPSADERPLTDALMAEDAAVGVAFKAAPTSNIGFVSTLRAREDRFRVNDTTTVEALFLPFPESFRQLQRRQVYRVALPLDHAIKVRTWHVPEHAILRDRPLAAQEVGCHLQNMSVAGMAVIARPGRDHQPARMIAGERLRITLAWNHEELLTEGRVVHFRPAHDDNVIFGVQFKKLEKDIEGRQSLSKLTELIGVLQRDEIKRRRALAESA